MSTARPSRANSYKSPSSLSPLSSPIAPFRGYGSPRSLSVPSSPQMTPLASSASMTGILDQKPKRLLLPTVRTPKALPTPASHSGDSHSSNASPRSRHRHSGSKLIRSRSGSTSLAPSEPSSVADSVGEIWLGSKSKFHILQEQLEIEGYQLYAVEKWIVERRPITVLTVFTGNPEHKITVTALSPGNFLSPGAGQSDWDKVLHDLRRDGARPKETEHGTLMVTSLANFRSDYTIVHIPEGNFLDIQEQLYTNINLLRMGCSGRSALTLEDPSDTTKDRFVSMYHFPTKIRSAPLFNPTVLELVKLIQAGLAICNMFATIQTVGHRCREIDGLLCEETADGIARWVLEIGESVVGVEPMERLADPTVVSALLSLILTVRNKLRAIGSNHILPKDPFLDPYGFIAALAQFQFSGRGHHSSSASLTSTPNLTVSTSPNGNGSNTTSASYLSRPVIDALNRSYEKLRQSESYKVHRALLNKLDDLTTDLRSAASGDGHLSSESQGGWAFSPTPDMAFFVKGIVGGDKKDGISSLRLLWTGRVAILLDRRRPPESVGANERQKKDSLGSEPEDKDRGEKTDGRSSDSDGERSTAPWGGRVQKKIESWAALSRKRQSVDLSKSKPEPPSSPSVPTGRGLQIPDLVITGDVGDEEDIMSSGQASPTPDVHSTRSYLGIGQLPRTATSSMSNISSSDYERRITEFDQKRPSTKPYYQSRIVSWSDPLSARGIMDEDELPSGKESGKESGNESGKDRDEKLRERRRKREGTGPSLGMRLARVSEHGEFLVETAKDDLDVTQQKVVPVLRRSRSFDEATPIAGIRVQHLDRMKIDVDLCGQMLIMRRRERHLRNVLDCLQVITQSLCDTNAHLREDYETHLPALTELEGRAQVIADIEADRSKVEAMEQETHALHYESNQFRVPELWYMAFPPRRKVLQLREKTFGTGGRRLPPGEHGAHGRFNRLQWTLDGRKRLVDLYGRTESEAEEEDALPDEYNLDPPYEEEDVVAHQGMKPTWLLKLFNSWGSQWGLFTAKPKDSGKTKEVKEQAASVDESDAGNPKSDSDPTSPVSVSLDSS
ncbi:hypothetical protein OE88DRAFT_1652183 [Heliocybe sulcata]|uniref:STB6-like N-terminal domain-containing protein n=1 Tax=Heliocybe sulcata TaxID=5364 RepID=A0A5C3NGX5_9AGAM|nr:hypothetical protein OE88DRAFT_1652183 [Heliocybe sulcata]